MASNRKWTLNMAPQENKPTRRRLVDSEFYAEQQENKKSKKPIIAVIAIAACAVCVGTAALLGVDILNKPAGTVATSTEPSTVAASTEPSTVYDGDKKDSSKKDSKKASASKSGSGSSTDGDSGSSASDGSGSNDGSGSSSGGSGSGSSGNDGSGSSGSSDSSSGSSASDGSSGSGSSASDSSEESAKTSQARSKLRNFYDELSNASDELKTFVDDVYNADLYKSLSKRQADYSKFKKLRKKLLQVVKDSDNDWIIYSYYAPDSLEYAKSELTKSSKLLVKRLNIINKAYKAINGLGKKATKKQITKASDKACANSDSTYNSFVKHMDNADSEL